MLTGVLEATVRDLQVKTPAPGFLAGSHPKVVRRHGQPAHTVPPRQRPAQYGPRPQRGSSPSPPRPAPPRIFTQRDHPPDEMSFLYGFVRHEAPLNRAG